MVIILDNADSILDPLGPNALEIYGVVEELSQFDNICLCITSRISVTPPSCETLDIPTLSMEAARDAFHQIYKNNKQPDLVDNILEQLDFHPLSVTLLAIVAHRNKWDTGRLNKEWEQRRSSVLHTEHNRSLAATIELSLVTPTFRELGPNARDFLSVIAFFPQGINENNLDWLETTTSNFFDWTPPTIPERKNIFDKLCVLSLTYRSNGFITMLAPFRDHLRPKDPALSPLLRTIKECYFNRLSVHVEPDKPGFEKAHWITLEGANIEHLLDAFMSIDARSDDVWAACHGFMGYLYWHKPQLVVLGPKIEGLPDDHPSKPRCLFQLSRLFESVGKHGERKRLLIHTLELWKERGNVLQVAHTLRFLADANRLLGLHEEGMERVEEALEVYERLNDVLGQAHSLRNLAWLLHDDNQLGAAEEAASLTISLLPDEGEHFLVSECHRLLGSIYHSKGETENAINHLETALGISSSFNYHNEQFWNHHSLAMLFFSEERFNDAHTHIERAKSHAINDKYLLGRATELQAEFWYKECRFEEAKTGALRAVEVYEEIGATDDVGDCRSILRDIEEKMKNPVTSGQSDLSGELPKRVVLSSSVNSPFVATVPSDDINTIPRTHLTHFSASGRPRVWTNIPFLIVVFLIIAATYPLSLF